eukprot:jgi/Psemu1/24011/gm1.24011_g
MSPSSSIIIQAETLQSNEVIIPQLYNGVYISVSEDEGLLKRPGRNGQVDNLIYCKGRMPDGNLHKGWKHVLVLPLTDKTSDQSYKTVTVTPSGGGSCTAGNVYVHYLPCNHKILPAL